jgi:hypothetical protein
MERKLWKPMDEFGLIVSLNSSINFRNFLSFHILSTQPNTPKNSSKEKAGK